ncbi:MAG: hypothetical protein HC854_10485 [Flavobacterium sp.]|nr:hypothetical protein [Flavobacterium sp.]
MLFLVLCNLSSFSQTTLGVGDIAFIGINFDGNDDYSFILLKEIQSGTQIRFTDYGWSDATGFATGVGGDSEWVWTSTSSLTCGSVVTIITSSLSASTGTVTLPPSESNPLLSSAGDQIFAFQGSLASPSFISAVHSNIQGSTTDANWDNTPTTNQNSALPDVLTNGVNAIRLYNTVTNTEIDNWLYNCAVVMVHQHP